MTASVEYLRHNENKSLDGGREYFKSMPESVGHISQSHKRMRPRVNAGKCSISQTFPHTRQKVAAAFRIIADVTVDIHEIETDKGRGAKD